MLQTFARRWKGINATLTGYTHPSRSVGTLQFAKISVQIRGNHDADCEKTVIALTLGRACAVAMMLGLVCGLPVAADDNVPAHKMPAPTPPAGGNTHANLGEAATNPVAALVSVRVQDQYSWENYNSSGYSNAAITQIVLPFKLPSKSVPELITRTTIPYVTTPDLGSPTGRRDGLGDTTMLLFGIPKLGLKGQTLGVGPVLVLPSAGDNEFTGSGKWQAGPAVVYINSGTPTWQWGALVTQQWDFASARSNSVDVSQFGIQPILTKHFKKGWYVGAPDLPQSYNFESKEWTLNLGAQLGRVFKIGKQPVQFFGEVLYNPHNNDAPSAEWTGKINISFLFPE